MRAVLIARGEWSAKRPYSVADMEAITRLEAHAEVWDALLAQGQKRAAHAAP